MPHPPHDERLCLGSGGRLEWSKGEENKTKLRNIAKIRIRIFNEMPHHRYDEKQCLDPGGRLEWNKNEGKQNENVGKQKRPKLQLVASEFPENVCLLKLVILRASIWTFSLYLFFGFYGDFKIHQT